MRTEKEIRDKIDQVLNDTHLVPLIAETRIDVLRWVLADPKPVAPEPTQPLQLVVGKEYTYEEIEAWADENERTVINKPDYLIVLPDGDRHGTLHFEKTQPAIYRFEWTNL
jgi:hypothetical protein